MRSLLREQNPNWKGGRTVSSHGYVRLRLPDHPHADVAGYVYEHRLVAERILGRYLLSGEIVHHQNGNKRDNRPENLVVERSIAEHKVEHRKRLDLRIPSDGNPIVACACGCGSTILKYDSSNRPRQYVTGHGTRGKHNFDSTAMVECACGCGTTFPKFDRCGRPRRFVTGHNMLLDNPRKRK